jgi:hypothetical protein
MIMPTTTFDQAKELVLEAAPFALDEKGRFELGRLRDSHNALYQKLRALNDVNRNYVSGLVFLMRRQGFLPQAGRMAAPVMPPSRAGSDAYAVPDNGNGHKERVRWTPEERETLATEFWKEFIQHPFEPYMKQFSAVQKRVFASDPSRIRFLGGFIGDHELSVAISRQWTALKERITKEPEIQIVTIEVPRPLTPAEMLKDMDYGTICGLKASYEDRRENLTQQLFYKIATQVGATDVPHVPEFKAPKPVERERKKRIVIVGPLKDQFNEVEKLSRDAGMDLDLRWLDKESAKPDYGYADYVVYTRHVSHDVCDGANKQIGKQRVFFVDGGIGQIVQKLRDINARQ